MVNASELMGENTYTREIREKKKLPLIFESIVAISLLALEVNRIFKRVRTESSSTEENGDRGRRIASSLHPVYQQIYVHIYLSLCIKR